LDTEFGALAMSPDGKSVIAGTDDGSLVEFSNPDLVQLRENDSHTRAITAIAVGRRGPITVVFSADRGGRIVQCIGSIKHEDCVQLRRTTRQPIGALIASKDVSQLVVAGDGFWAWDLRGETLRGKAEQLAGTVP
jgi:hypothetical protein